MLPLWHHLLPGQGLPKSTPSRNHNTLHTHEYCEHGVTMMVPDISRWRSSSTYDFVDDLVSPDLAWEWLRRNQNYQRDYRDLMHQKAEIPPGLAQLRQVWGLSFPGTSRTLLRRYTDLLDAHRRHRRRPACGFTALSF